MLRPLLIPVMCICLPTWLGTAQAQHVHNLSMVPDAFDDQYIGCVEVMDVIAPELLEVEMSYSSLFSMVWKTAIEKWKDMKTKVSLPGGFGDEHGQAIIAYSDKYKYNNEVFQRIFNEAVRGAGTSQADYMANFQFKALHYYLTRALQLLQGRCEVTHHTPVYQRVSDAVHWSKDDLLRFGYFASLSMKKEKAKRFDTATLFTVHTCFGVHIRSFSHFPDHEEVLIPVHEMFSVFPGTNSSSYVLRSTNRTCSHFNCAYLGKKKNQTCIDNSGGVAFPREMSPSLFGGSVILTHVAALKLFAGF
ncbi:ecto-ADP-ribosyltransferase 5-like [Pelodiscus sinensis]|uniref:ecto-ADP-ribosyltransferase 5-like n=1 Tax=Pelodiscus sinensis TaxID=13735 RepID=UPI003F6C38AA